MNQISSLYRNTSSYRLALLVAALALSAPERAAAEAGPISSEDIRNLADLSDIEAVLGDGSVREILASPELGALFFEKFTMLEISYEGVGDGPQAEISFFAVENNTSLADNRRLDRQIEALNCDGSVRLAHVGAGACDGSVMPVPVLETLSIQGTINPSITMSGVLTDNSLDGDSNFGIIASMGLAGFDPGTWLEGVLEMSSIFPQQVAVDPFTGNPEPVGPFDPILDVAVRGEVLGVNRDFYLLGLVDFGIGGFTTVEDAMLRRSISDDSAIPQGMNRTFFELLGADPFQCPQCTTLSAGLGFASPGRGGVEDPGYTGTRTSFGTTFRVYEVPGPAVIPLPAAGWLLLGGLGMLAALGRRRRLRN